MKLEIYAKRMFISYQIEAASDQFPSLLGLVAMHFAKNAAASALLDSWKSIKLCQANILMSIYAAPPRR